MPKVTQLKTNGASDQDPASLTVPPTFMPLSLQMPSQEQEQSLGLPFPSKCSSHLGVLRSLLTCSAPSYLQGWQMGGKAGRNGY
jgi:hypothetical protein